MFKSESNSKWNDGLSWGGTITNASKWWPSPIAKKGFRLSKTSKHRRQKQH